MPQIPEYVEIDGRTIKLTPEQALELVLTSSVLDCTNCAVLIQTTIR